MNVLKLEAILGLDKSQFDSGLDSASGKMGSFGSAIGSGFKKIAQVGAAALAGATTAVTAFAGASVKVGADFDKSMSQVVATMGYSVEELNTEGSEAQQTMQKLRDFAREMGATTAFSATQAADALNYMALAGYDAETSMNMLPNVLNLAAAGSFDLARASDMVTDTQTAFGLSLERTSQMVDEMAKAASTGNTSVEQLGDAFLVVGGLAKELNGGMIMLSDGTFASTDGVQELEIALTAMANAGIKGSEAGTHMRNMLLKLSSPTAEGTKQLEALGVQVFDTEGNMNALSDIMLDLSTAMDGLTQEEKLQAISEIFNTRDVASAEALMAAVGEDWAKIGESILDAEGAAAAMAGVQLDNLAGDITIFKSALSDAQIELSDQLTPSLREFVQLGTTGLQNITAGFKSGGLDGAMEAVGNTLTDGIAKIAAGAPKAVQAGIQLIGALGKGLMQNLPTLLKAGSEIITMVGTAIIEGAPALFTAAQEILGMLGQGIIEAAPDALALVFELIPQLIDGLSVASEQFLLFGADLLLALAQGVQENFPTFIEQFMTSLVDFTTNLRENFGTFVDAGIQLLMSLAQGLIAGIPTFIETIPIIVSNIAGLINDNAPKLLEAGLELIVQLGLGLISAIPVLLENIPLIFQAIWDVWTAINWLELGTKVITAIKEGFTSMATDLPTKLKEFGDSAVEKFKNIDWKQLGRNVINFIKNGLEILKEEIPKKLKSIGESAVKFVKEIDWLDLGKSIVNGIAEGISKFGDAIMTAVLNAAKGAFDAVKKFFGISSPSKLMRDEIGKWVPLGFAEGVEDNLEPVYAAFDRMYEPLDGTMETVTSGSDARLVDLVNIIVSLLYEYLPNRGDADDIMAQLDRQLGIIAA